MDELIKFWKEEEQVPVVGWTFPHMEGRILEDVEPWSYMQRAKELMVKADSVCDLETGGAERLIEMQDVWPKTVVATEAYPPNVKLARERLDPLGATLIDTKTSTVLPIPLEDESFDLIINRHSSFNPAELWRVLTPGGTFYTQQVHGYMIHDLLAAFNAPIPWPEATPEINVPLLEAAGFEIIESEDWTGKITYTDVGAIVYYFKTVPWMIEGFSVDTHLDYLIALQKRLETEGSLQFETKKYMIEAQKPI